MPIRSEPGIIGDMQGSLFREVLHREFAARRKKNRRYSLRAFAASLGADHSTLSQILHGRRRAPMNSIRAWAIKLGMDREEIILYVAAENVPDAATTERQEKLKHWTAEASIIATESVHWQILRLARTPGFRTDCRWIAMQTGAGVDKVNLALSRLLRLRLLGARAPGQWTDLTGLPPLTEREFRTMALARVREKAVDLHSKPGEK